MAKNTKIKLYTYHGKYLPIKHKAQNRWVKFLVKTFDRIFDFFYLTGLAVIKFLFLGLKLLVLACFKIGSAIIYPIIKLFTAAKNDVLKTGKLWPKRLKLIFEPQYRKALIIFLIIAGLAWASLGSMNLIAKGLEIKNKIMRVAFLGNSYLSQAKDALSNQDFTQAQNRFALAFQTFDRGQGQIQESGQLLNQLLSLVPQKRDADKLLQAASLVAQSGQSSIELQQSISLLKLSPTGINSTGGNTKDVLDTLQTNLDATLRKLSQANDLVNQVDINNLPAQNRQNFLDLKTKLYAANLALNNFNQVFSLGKNLLVGSKNVLILMENNNELRASGGFIGTFGNLKLQDGHLSKINVSSVYDLDGQLKDIIRPPEPILNVNARWFLRDANWFSDFPSSAKKVSNFYEMEGGETPDLIIAITPNIIIDWLKITGPITLPKYGVTLTAENFVEQ
ncbi:MAG TPA: DUF4012 domain-containing protein, partial [Candidatus Limnocylindria bacterium]|nr:DUF4012 domain-containing protein [Candidatus Limnocylindria bacterium]